MTPPRIMPDEDTEAARIIDEGFSRMGVEDEEDEDGLTDEDFERAPF